MTTIRVQCNRCKTVRQGKPGTTLAELREALAGVGWTSSPAQNLDVCGSCRRARSSHPGGAS